MNRTAVLTGILSTGLAFVLSVSPLQAQEFLGKNAAEWTAQLSAKQPGARRGAAFALGKLGSNGALAASELVKMLKTDADASVREAAAFALGDICKEAAIARNTNGLLAALKQKLTDTKESQYVRRSCAYALGCMGDSAANALEDLDKAARDPSPAVRQNVAWALGSLGKTGVLSLQKILQKENDSLVVRDAAGALGSIGPDAAPAIPQLIQHCNDGDVEVQKAVMAALVPIVTANDAKTAAPVLQKVVNNNKRIMEVRRNAALALSNIGGDAAVPAVPVLVHVLKTDEIAYRRQAAAAINNIGPKAKAAVGPLRVALKNRDAEIRRNAAVALGGIGENATAAVPDLVALVANNREKAAVRETAAMALRHIGNCKAAEKAIPTLVAVVKNRKNPPDLRKTTLRSMDSNGVELLSKRQDYLGAMESVVKEPRTKGTKMLRYDAAYLLGILKGDTVSDAVLDTLQEFLADKDLQIYVGTATGTTAGTEGSAGTTNITQQGKYDGRKLAVQSLSQIGYRRIMRTHQQIIMQMRRLANDPNTEKNLRDSTKKVLSAFGA